MQPAFFFFQIFGFVTIFDTKIVTKPDTQTTLNAAFPAGLLMLHPSGVNFFKKSILIRYPGLDTFSLNIEPTFGEPQFLFNFPTFQLSNF